MVNLLEESILSGIRNGIKNDIPELTRSIQSENILKAIELDNEFQLGIFSNEERRVIIEKEKELFLNRNKDIKRKVKELNQRK